MYLRNVKTQFRHHWMLICLALLWLPLTVFSQTAMIDGTVMCGEQPIVGAEVVFTPEYDQAIQYTAVTDTAGYFHLSVVTGVEDRPPVVPQHIELLQNYPNPFSNGTVIAYRLHRPGAVSVTIYDVLGRQVRSFTEQMQPAGMHNIAWDGRNAQGANVATGIYFYRIKSGGQVMTKKMLYTGAEHQVRQHSNFAYSQADIRDQKVTAGGTHYSVKISNNDGTIPRIEPAEHNVTVRVDTTLALGAETLEQWEYLGLEGETVSAIAIDPVNPSIIYAGTSSDFSEGIQGKLFKSIDAGVTWDTLLVGGGYRDILIDPVNHNVIYALPGIFIKSLDGGLTWKDISNGMYLDYEHSSASMAINPLNTNVLYAGTSGVFGGNLYKSFDGGFNWYKTGSDSLHEGMLSIAIDPADTNIVYVGTSMRCILWQSLDAGNNWLRTGFVGGALIFDAFIDPYQTSQIYIGSDGIFKKDSVTSFIDISQGLPAPSKRLVVKIQKCVTNRLFINVTYEDDGGVFEFSTQHNRWFRIGIDNLHESYYYSELTYSSESGKLYFGGNGVYVRELKY